MTSAWTVVSLCLKLLKLVLNLIVLILYRTGYGGEFLGIGGTWNLNEEKDPNAEIVASGVFVIYLIYTFVTFFSYCFNTRDHKNSITEIGMNVVGVIMWVAIGATALHYWAGYLPEHKYSQLHSEKQVGLAVGSMCVISGAFYLLDSVISVIHYSLARKN